MLDCEPGGPVLVGERKAGATNAVGTTQTAGQATDKSSLTAAKVTHQFDHLAAA